MELTNKKILILSFSNKGALLSKKIEEILKEANTHNYTYYKYADNNNLKSFVKIKELINEVFQTFDFIIFIGAVGIAVREIAPNLKNKMVDPGVIVIDELANFTIPILSGHIGQANLLSRFIADKINSTLVITTATDINNRFSIDEWASVNNMKISNMNKFKELASLILNEDIGFKTDFSYDTLPNGLNVNKDNGIYVTYHNESNDLRIIPKVLHLGIGCKKGTSFDTIDKTIKEVFKDNNLNIDSIKDINSIDLKKDEEGIIKLANKLNIPFNTYSKDELNKLDGEYSYSEFVYNTVGVDCVCERSAMINSTKGLILRKKALNGITISVGIDDYKLSFNYR